MEEIIKSIRYALNMNQEQLANKLGVSPITVNRWENGKSIPNTRTQERLFELCQKNQIDLAQQIINNVKGVDGMLYHASRSSILGDIQPISRSKCDFGRGFYMGSDPLQPLTLVCNEESPTFYSLNLNTEGINCLEIEIGIDWAMMIAYYRGYMKGYENTALYNKYAHMADHYDVIIGYIADDRMYQVLTDFFEERITDTALLASLSALKPGRQYVAITQKARNQITILNEKRLSKLELMVLKKKSIVRRKEGIALANQIVKEHRRDGRYFDEILKGVID